MLVPLASSVALTARSPLPDLSAEYRLGRSWGYVEAAGIVRQIYWDDTDGLAPDLSDNAIGWGVNLSTNLKTGPKGTLRLQAVYGEGIENYMNDAPATSAPSRTSATRTSPFRALCSR
jgi:hypothetical protein